MRKLLVVAVCGGLLAGVGCGGKSRLDETTWCARAAEAECHWIYSCCNVGERLTLTGLNAHEESEPTCREKMTASCLDEWAVALASIAASRLRFDPETAQACIDATQTMASQCPTTVEKADECGHVVAGLVGTDGECAYDEECSGQARCRRATTGAAGRCYDRSGEGGLCETTVDCQKGLFCWEGTTPQYVCVAVVPVGLGETCNTTSLVCDQGTYCSSSSYRCVAQKASGESCTASEECQEGLVCDGTRQCGVGLGVGQACSYSQVCAVGLFCDTSGATDVCASRKGEGSTCYVSTECDASLYCDTTDHCAPRIAPGSTCPLVNDSCQPSYVCEARGTCNARGGVGSECYGADQCLEQLLCNAESRACEATPPKLPAGSFCEDGAECESGTCSSGECLALCAGEL
jgi:hypothetical protein